MAYDVGDGGTDVTTDVFRRSTRDEETGLKTRPYFQRVLEHELRRAHRYGRPVSLVRIQIESLPPQNFAAQRQAAIGQLSALFAAGIRDADIAVRLGERDFAVVLPEIAGKAAIGYAQRVVAELGHMGLPAHAGVAPFDTGHESPVQMLARAEHALAGARAGSHRVVMTTRA